MSADLDLRSELTDDERDVMELSFLAFHDAAQASGIDAEKIALFALIKGAYLLTEARSPLLTLSVLKSIAGDLVATHKERLNS